MATAGVPTGRLTPASLIDELVGNREGSSRRITVLDLARQLMSTPAFAEMVDAGMASMTAFRSTLEELEAVDAEDGAYGAVISNEPEGGVYERVAGEWVQRAPIPAILTYDLSAEEARQAREESKAWAATPEDQAVADGLYSARHYQAKVEARLDQIGDFDGGVQAAQQAANLALAGSPYRLRTFGDLAARLRYSGATGDQIAVAGGDTVDLPGGGAYEVLAADAGQPDLDYTGTSGPKLKVLSGPAGRSARAYGLIGGRSPLDTTGLAKAVAAEGKVHFDTGEYGFDTQLLIRRSDVHLSFAKDARLMPTQKSSCLNIAGSEPTVWFDLAADAPEGSSQMTLLTDPGASWDVGKWVELRSNKPIRGTNTEGGKVAWIGRIVARVGLTFYFDKPLYDDFLVADAAVAGQPTMLENIYIECPNINREDFDTEIAFGLYFGYCARVTIVAPSIYGSKPRNGPDTNSGVNAIRIGHGCIDVTILDASIGHIAWYGIGVGGFVDGLEVIGGDFWDCRHAISVVWSASYGEPHNLTFTDVTGRNCNLAIYDTHDTGRNIVFNAPRAFGSRGDAGFQLRSADVRLNAPTAAYNAFDGIVCRTDGRRPEIYNPHVYMNGRSGLSLNYGHVVKGGKVERNSRAGAGGYALATRGGEIDGTLLRGRDGLVLDQIVYLNEIGEGIDEPLAMQGVQIPLEAAGQWAVHVAATRSASDVILNGCRVPGYGSNLVRGGAAGGAGPVRRGNVMSAVASERRGRAQLSGGYARIPIPGMYRRTGDPIYQTQLTVRHSQTTAIDNKGNLTVELMTTGAGGYVDVRSSNASDANWVEWEIDG
ncbi:hypothetical protein [Frigidibacter oleivorans]|uniref:hypothetical protein n=1 Tax=Frigidibacter oleivorans TaxID=2487129 RepID=UPI000F8D2676|nr:hypothetical protein [Frigidibacter oleivorans]